MKFGKIVLAGIVVGILNGIWGSLTCGKIFNWVYLLEPAFVWKTLEEIPFVLASVSGIIFAILLTLVYAVIKGALPGKGILKGLSFGVLVWLVGALPGNFALGLYTVINSAVITYWIIWGLVTCLWQGVVIAAIYK